jgi:DNA/RNA-binding domain of Phe-tRNA-synthetase-like protein
MAASEKEQLMELLKSEALDRIPVLWKIYRDLGVERRNSRVDAWVAARVEEIREKAAVDGGWREGPLFRGYVILHDRFCDEKGIRSSCEGLIDFILKRGSVPRINTFVDVYNVVSALTGVSIGAHDVDRLVGDPRLDLLDRDRAFVPIGGRGEGRARKGEFAYVDEEGIICRMDIRQCDRTKTTEDTTGVFVIFQGHEAIEPGLLERSISILDEAVTQLWPSGKT